MTAETAARLIRLCSLVYAHAFLDPENARQLSFFALATLARCMQHASVTHVIAGNLQFMPLGQYSKFATALPPACA